MSLPDKPGVWDQTPTGICAICGSKIERQRFEHNWCMSCIEEHIPLVTGTKVFVDTLETKA